MREVTTTVYTFDELSEEAKRSVLEQFSYINVEFDWGEFIYEDAKTIGCEINGFDIGRGACCNLKLTKDVLNVIDLIIENHGECDTYKTAREYKEAITVANDNYDNDMEGDPEISDAYESIVREFTYALAEDYRIMLQREYEYMTGEEAITETIRCNEYEFTEHGKQV